MRDFDAMLAEKANVRPTFKVAGQEFSLRAKLPYRKWRKVQQAMRADDITAHEANLLFFGAVLVRGDVDRFLDLLDADDDDDGERDDTEELGVDQLDEIISWAPEHFTGKPSESGDGSTSGANTTGAAPNVVSLQSKQAANG